MTIWEKLRDNYKIGLRTKDKHLIDYMRSARAIIEVEMINCGVTNRQEDPGDNLCTRALQAHLKKLQKACDIVGFGDLKFEYENEIACIRTYLLPKPNTTDTIKLEKIIDRKIEELGATSKPKMIGQVIGAVMKTGKFDGSLVRRLVTNKLGT